MVYVYIYKCIHPTPSPPTHPPTHPKSHKTKHSRYDLPYCPLYDRGYTSLGKIDDTLPNPALARLDAPGEFFPAYMLQDWALERAGRVDKKKAKKEQHAKKEVEEEGTGEKGDAECELRDFAEFRARVRVFVFVFVLYGVYIHPPTRTHAHIHAHLNLKHTQNKIPNKQITRRRTPRRRG